jgi:hypothetical protein
MGRPGELASTPRRRFHAEVLLYTGLALALGLGGLVYYVWSKEAAGTVLLTASGGFAAIVAAYLGFQDRLERTMARAPTSDGAVSDDDQFLPHASIWPFEMGVGVATTLTGMVLGWAILVPGLVLLMHSVIGWIGQSRRRSNR